MMSQPEKKQKIDHGYYVSKKCNESDIGCHRHLKIGIIGGGLGGLGVALSLQMIGINNITVFERDEFFGDRKQGYGLTLTNNKKGALAKLGLLDECVRRDCPSTCHWIFAPSGQILGYYGRSFKTADSNEPEQEGVGENSVFAERGNLRVPRQDLRQLLIDKLKPGTIQWGKRLKDYVEDDNGVRLIWEESGVNVIDGGSDAQAFDIVIGADGLRSIVRQLRDKKMNLSSQPSIRNGKSSGPSGLLYSGVAVILGIASGSHPLIAQQGFYVLDGTHRLFTMPFRCNEGRGSDGPLRETMWQLSFSGLGEQEALLLKGRSPNELLAEALRRTEGWLDPVKQLISSTPSGEVWSTPLYDREPMVVKKGGSRVTLLGDAAHPMTMFKGQGCNQALEDGPLLAYWLLGGPSSVTGEHRGRDKHFAAMAMAERALNESAMSNQVLSRGTLLTRLRCYEREMVSRTTKKVQASRNAAHFLHSSAVLTECHGFEGIPQDRVSAVLAELGSLGIGGRDGAAIVQRVKSVIDDCGAEQCARLPPL